MKENIVETKKAVVADVYLTPGFNVDMLRSTADNAESIVLVIYDSSVEISEEVENVIQTSTTPIFIAKSQTEHDAVKALIKQSFQEGKRGADLHVAVNELIKSHE